MVRLPNLRNLDREARKRGESTTGLCKRKRFLDVFFFCAGSRIPGNERAIFSWSRDSAEKGVVENFRLVLTKIFYLSNIRPVSWGVQRNVWGLAMYSRHTLQIRRARDASTGHALPVYPDV